MLVCDCVMLKCVIALCMTLLCGCGGGGGGGGSGASASSVAPNPSPTPTSTSSPVVVSVQFGTPSLSDSASGRPAALNGPVFTGNIGYVELNPPNLTNIDLFGPNIYSNMTVWLQVNTSGAAIERYDWSIVGWKNEHPHGGLSYEDRRVNINLSANAGSNYDDYLVQTYPSGGGNKIRYNSTSIGVINRLTAPYAETVSVTAWTADGKFATAFFNIYLRRL